MFVKAIEETTKYTRALHTITRTYGGLVSPGSATFFFVNEDGVAVTCKHVLNMILQADAINNQYNNFKADAAKLTRDHRYVHNLKGLEMRYNLKKETTIQVKNNFINAVYPVSTMMYHTHPTLDLAIIIFQGFTGKLYDSYATFVSDPNKVKQGKYLCRLGYPFPEFNNFQHNETTDEIEWTGTGVQNSPIFPIDGIITRFVADQQGQIIATELSTPGLRGQSGGPLFDTDGLVYGMQSGTNHLHLGFDIKDLEVVSDGRLSKVSNAPFLHVGHCVHADRIKEFLTLHNIKFYQE